MATLSKANYEAVAEIIQDLLEAVRSDPEGTRRELWQLYAVARRLAAYFQLNNPRFSHDRFMEAACGHRVAPPF